MFATTFSFGAASRTSGVDLSVTTADQAVLVGEPALQLLGRSAPGWSWRSTSQRASSSSNADDGMRRVSRTRGRIEEDDVQPWSQWRRIREFRRSVSDRSAPALAITERLLPIQALHPVSGRATGSSRSACTARRLDQAGAVRLGQHVAKVAGVTARSRSYPAAAIASGWLTERASNRLAHHGAQLVFIESSRSPVTGFRY